MHHRDDIEGLGADVRHTLVMKLHLWEIELAGDVDFPLVDVHTHDPLRSLLNLPEIDCEDSVATPHIQ